MYRCSKTYGHERGLSCCFRQWRADSHCSQLHGYALKVHVELESAQLDARNWVYDFGAFKPLKAWLEGMFDHTTVVAGDDPLYDTFVQLDKQGLIDMRVVPAVGCEAFAGLIGGRVLSLLADYNRSNFYRKGLAPVMLHHVRVAEHDGNSTVYDAVAHNSAVQAGGLE